MSRMGAKTYSRKTDCKQSMQFEHLLTEKGNKPSTAKVSVAGIHRWGMTSYTSLRKSRLNGGQTDVTESVEPVKKPKLDFSTNVVSSGVDSFDFEMDSTPNDVSVLQPVQTVKKPEAPPAKPRPNKFFKSKNAGSKNNDFDALRLSTPSNTTSVKSSRSSDLFNTLQQSTFKNNAVPQVAIEPDPVYLTSTKLDSYDSNYNSGASNAKCTNLPTVHYISPVIQRVAPQPDPSAVAFDALFATDLTTSKNCGPIDFSPVHQPIVKDTDVPLVCLDSEENTINEFSLNYKRPESQAINLSKSCDKKMICDSDSPADKIPCTTTHSFTRDSGFESRSNASSQEVIFSSQPSDSFTSSQEMLPLSQTSITSSQETLPSSQSSQTSDVSTVSKTSRVKKIFSSSKSSKDKARYNHRHWQSSNKPQDNFEEKGPSLADEFEDEIATPPFRKEFSSNVSTASSAEITPYLSISSQEYYPVIKNVKKAYQCHESGETQEFNDDIEYLLECVQECNVIGTRCLSILNLAAKCMGPAFRIHLRAHGTMPKIFSALKDAPTDPNLALCTATLMFVLSQDRLTMDIEASTLSLMLQLLETDPEMRSPEKEYDLILKDPALCAMQDKHREKVFALCEEMQQKGHAKHLKLDNINTGILAMETLLSLTSRKAGEWFKEEMRTLRGLDRIVDTVTSAAELLCADENPVVQLAEVQLDKIRKIDRCLRVLENVTHLNAENQDYLVSYKESALITSCLNLLRLFKSHLLEQQPVENDSATEDSSQKASKNESPVLSCILNILKILNNITYQTALDDTKTEDGLMDQLLMLILQVPKSVPLEKRFDLVVLSLGVLINLVEYCPQNSLKFIEMHAVGPFDGVNDGYEMPVTEALIELMNIRLESARLSEEQADELLSNQEVKQAESIQKKDIETAAEDLEETLMKTLQKAGKHMEHSVVAAYISILVGCVSKKNPDYIEVMRDYVPDGKFDVMIEVLKKFKSFVTLTGTIGNREVAAIQKVIQVFESS